MTENLLQTLQQLVQDVIAPDVRELKVRASALEKQGESQFEALDKRMDNLQKQMETQYTALQRQNEAQYHSVLAAIAESRAQAEVLNVREMARLSERIAVLESQRH